MDGASKFVRGDAIAGIFITVVNIVGGLYIGMVEKGWGRDGLPRPVHPADDRDGLVSSVPAFITSLAAGLIVHPVGDQEEPRRGDARAGVRPPAGAGHRGRVPRFMTFTGLPLMPLLVLGGRAPPWRGR
jgi:flagellar biosynthesis protein FlhA